jgi:hypothetical protein
MTAAEIGQEDVMIVPMTDSVLTEADQPELCAPFAEVDRTLGPDIIPRLETPAKSLAPEV